MTDFDSYLNRTQTTNQTPQQVETKPEMSLDDAVKAKIRELGSQGGNVTKSKYGLAHYSNAGKLGAMKRWGTKTRGTTK